MVVGSCSFINLSNAALILSSSWGVDGEDENADWYSIDSNKEWGEMISGLEISDAGGSG